jgi:hypothetical protein
MMLRPHQVAAFRKQLIAAESLRREKQLLSREVIKQLQAQASFPKWSFSSKVVPHSQTLQVEPCEEFDSLCDLTN